MRVVLFRRRRSSPPTPQHQGPDSRRAGDDEKAKSDGALPSCWIDTVYAIEGECNGEDEADCEIKADHRYCDPDQRFQHKWRQFITGRQKRLIVYFGDRPFNSSVLSRGRETSIWRIKVPVPEIHTPLGILWIWRAVEARPMVPLDERRAKRSKATTDLARGRVEASAYPS